MKTIKEGRICKQVYRGICIKCGCIIECTEKEYKRAKTVKCPTIECNEIIQLFAHNDISPFEKPPHIPPIDPNPDDYPWPYSPRKPWITWKSNLYNPNFREESSPMIIDFKEILGQLREKP